MSRTAGHSSTCDVTTTTTATFYRTLYSTRHFEVEVGYIYFSLFLSSFFLYLHRSCSVGHVAPSLLAHRRSVENYHRRAQFIRPERAVSRQLQNADESDDDDDDDGCNTPLCQLLYASRLALFRTKGEPEIALPGLHSARRSSRGTVASRHVTSLLYYRTHSRGTNLTHPDEKQDKEEHRLRNPGRTRGRFSSRISLRTFARSLVRAERSPRRKDALDDDDVHGRTKKTTGIARSLLESGTRDRLASLCRAPNAASLSALL